MESDPGHQAILSGIAIDRAEQAPLFRQIYARVRSGIAGGVFGAGTRLPSARNLASELGVARGTIEDAYGLLAAEGYVERRGRRGTSVAALGSRLATVEASPPRRRAPVVPEELSPGGRTVVSPFQMGLPALDAFPGKSWSRLVARVARQSAAESRGTPDPLGYEPLRAAIARYLALSRGVICTAEQILITNGYQAAIDLVAHATLTSGDSAWIEDPGYQPARQALAGTSARLVAISVDREGMRVADGIRRAPDARLVVTTPAHQAPLCVALALPRRLSLLDWAARNGAWIVEDDYDGEFHYDGRPLPALKSLDRHDRVIYAGSFSKTLFPGLRIGYLVSPLALLDRLSQMARWRSASPGPFMQSVVAAFIEDGQFVRHLERMRRLYAARRTTLVRELQQVFGTRLAVDVERGGMHIVARLSKGISDKVVAERAREAGLAVASLSGHSMARRPDNGLLIAFTNVEERRAALLSRKLYGAIGDLL